MKTLFEVITDYGNDPSFNPSVTDVTVLGQDESGAEFPAGWNTKTGKQTHAFHCCEVSGTVFGVERTYHGIDGSSTWIVRPAGQGRSTLTIDGSMRVWLLRGLVMKLFLKRILYATDLRPFIEEGERRHQEAGSRPRGVTSLGLPIAGSARAGHVTRGNPATGPPRRAGRCSRRGG